MKSILGYWGMLLHLGEFVGNRMKWQFIDVDAITASKQLLSCTYRRSATWKTVYKLPVGSVGAPSAISFTELVLEESFCGSWSCALMHID